MPIVKRSDGTEITIPSVYSDVPPENAMAIHPRMPMWCDDFDGDLLKLIPEAEEIAAPIADLAVWTWGSKSRERLNHPTVWNTDHGLTCFLSLLRSDDPRPSLHYSISDAKLVECTGLELLRDLFIHQVVPAVRAPGVGEHIVLAYCDQWQADYFVLLFAARTERKHDDPPAPTSVAADQEAVDAARASLIEGIRLFVSRLRAIADGEPVPILPLPPESGDGEVPDDCENDDFDDFDDEDDDWPGWDDEEEEYEDDDCDDAGNQPADLTEGEQEQIGAEQLREEWAEEMATQEADARAGLVPRVQTIRITSASPTRPDSGLQVTGGDTPVQIVVGEAVEPGPVLHYIEIKGTICGDDDGTP